MKMDICNFNMRDPLDRAVLADAIQDGVGPEGVSCGYEGGRGEIYGSEKDAFLAEGTEALAGGPCLYTWDYDGCYADWSVRI